MRSETHKLTGNFSQNDKLSDCMLRVVLTRSQIQYRDIVMEKQV